MNETLYILMSDGQNAPYPEEHVRYWWSQGSLPRETMYWKQGMPEWRPLTELLGAPPFAPPLMPAAMPYAQSVSSAPMSGQTAYPTRAVHNPVLFFVKDPVGLTQALKTMLVIFFCICLLQMYANYLQMALLETGRSPMSRTAEASENTMRQAGIGLLYLMSFLGTTIVFGMWTYRANVNVRGFGAQNLQFTPGWAFGYYFIPIFNLFRPYQAMREIWKASKNPQNWEGENGYKVVKVWWGLWLLTNYLSLGSFSRSFQAGITMSTTMGDIIINCVEVILTIAAIMMVSEILTMQMRVIGRQS